MQVQSWGVRFLWIAVAVVAAVALLIPMPLAAQRSIYLEDVQRSMEVMAEIRGRSITFSQPMAGMTVLNKTADDLVIVTRMGLVLESLDPAHADLVISQDAETLLSAGATADVELFAFSLDPNLKFPPSEVKFQVGRMSDDDELVSLLGRINEQGAGQNHAAQLAVWMHTQDYSYEEVEDTLGVGLGRYYTDTLRLLEEPATPSPSSLPPTVVSTLETPSAGVGTPTPIIVAQETTQGRGNLALWILAAVAVVFLAVIGVLAFLLWQKPKNKVKEEDTDRVVPQPTSPPPAAPDLCIVCEKPMNQCTCAGRVRPEPAPLPQPEKKTDQPPSGKTVIVQALPRLVALEGDCIGRKFDLPQEDVLLTRAKLPFLTIPLGVVSAPHALILLDQQPFKIKDLNSANGTRVDGLKLSGNREADPTQRVAALRDGARITLGNVDFAFGASPPVLRDQQGNIHTLPLGTRVIISRREIPFQEIDDGTVSVPHALVCWESEQHRIKDLNSGNGTEVGLWATEGFDYQAVIRPMLLRTGRRLRVGKVVLEVQPASGPLDWDSGDRRIGPYQILRIIGHGGMATVSEGRGPKGRRVAIKVPRDIYAYDPSFRKRFEREARSMERLHHPRIVPIVDVGEDKSGGYLVNGMGLQYIAMEYVDGCALDRLLVSDEPLDQDVIVEVVRSVAEGLQHAHNQGVIHRDVKPSNFLVSRQGQILITDFGIAWATGEAAITRPGECPGSPHYISPEQAAGRTDSIDARSDIYSLGIVLYQMITGKVPFDGDTPAPTILIKHQSELPLPPKEVRADVPEHLARVAMKCLEKDPGARYQTAEDVIDALPALPSATSKLARLAAKAVSERKVTDTNVR